MSEQNDRVGPPACIEPLEPRTLFSSYLYHSPGDALHLYDVIRVLPEQDPSRANFGAVIASLGDIDNDGVADIAVAAPGRPAGILAEANGGVHLFSGASGGLIRTLTDDTPGFGSSLVSMGDLNNDGVPDLLVGSPGYDVSANAVYDPTGRAYVYSGADGSIILTMDGVTPDGDFGRAVARLADANNDGVADMLVGAPGRVYGVSEFPDGPGPAIPGEVLLFSGADGALLRSFSGEANGDRFGAAVATTTEGGMDSGFFAVGAPRAESGALEDAGRVYVYSLDGTQAYVLSGGQAGDEFGAALVITGNIPELAEPQGADRRLVVGAPRSDFGEFTEGVLTDRGRIESFLLRDGSSRVMRGAFDATEYGYFGSSLSLVNDLDFDGLDDVMVFSPTTGRAYAYSPRLTPMNDGLALRRGAAIGSQWSIPVLVGDVDGDGVADLAAADPAGGVRLFSSVAAGPPLFIDGASPDRRFMWSQSSQRPILFEDGVARAFDHVPGLRVRDFSDPDAPWSVVQGIDNSGRIFFIDQTAGGQRTDLMVLANGVGVTLESLVETVVGETPDYAALRFVRVGSGGHVLLREEGPDGRAYVLSEGVLTALWVGSVDDVNGAGVVVGTDGTTAVMWTSAGGTTPLAGLTGTLAINDGGVVVGTRAGTISDRNPGTLATWNDGTLTHLGRVADLPEGMVSSWLVTDFDEDHRVLAILQSAVSGQDITSYTMYLSEPDDGLRPLATDTHGKPAGTFGATSGFDGLRPTIAQGLLGPEGTIFAFNSILTPISQRDIGTLRSDSPVASITVSDVTHTAGFNQYGEIVVFRATGGTWSVRRIAQSPASAGNQQLLFVTSRGSIALVVGETDSLRVYDLNATSDETGADISSGFRSTPIVRGLTTFTNKEGAVHLVGFNDRDELVMYFRYSGDEIESGSGWVFVNLTQDHLEVQGLTTPAIFASLTAYTTDWSGMNIAGVDPEGHLHAIWWAPGMNYWRTSDLSESVSGVPFTLFGNVTAFVTPWSTMHINGTDDQGRVRALWWAPGFGEQWRGETLDALGPRLESASLASFVTPWGGLNIVGRGAETGEVVVYWWSPQLEEWRAELLPSATEPLVAEGKLTAHVDTGGVVTQHVFARDSAGDVQHLSWSPNGDPWTLEDVTAAL